MGTIKEILYKHVPCCEVRVFGSRKKGKHKKHSDLDLALVSKERIPDNILLHLREEFQDSDLPFRVDVIQLNSVSEEFREIINSDYEVLHQSPQENAQSF